MCQLLQVCQLHGAANNNKTLLDGLRATRWALCYAGQHGCIAASEAVATPLPAEPFKKPRCMPAASCPKGFPSLHSLLINTFPPPALLRAGPAAPVAQRPAAVADLPHRPAADLLCPAGWLGCWGPQPPWPAALHAGLSGGGAAGGRWVEHAPHCLRGRGTAGFIAAGIVVALFIVDRDELPQRQRHLDTIDELSVLPAKVPQSMPHTRDMVQAWLDGFLAMRQPAIAAQQRCERTLCAISMITQLVCPQSEVDAWVAAAAQARQAAAAQEQPSTAAQLLTVAAGAGQPQGGEAPPQQAAAEQEAAG